MSKIKPGELVTLRNAPDAQVYTLEKIEGRTAHLSYKRGANRAETETDAGLIRKATPEQLKYSTERGLI